MLSQVVADDQAERGAEDGEARKRDRVEPELGTHQRGTRERLRWRIWRVRFHGWRGAAVAWAEIVRECRPTTPSRIVGTVRVTVTVTWPVVAVAWPVVEGLAVIVRSASVACFAGFKLKMPGVQFGNVDGLTARQRGVVGDRGQLPAHEEGVPYVHAQADDHD